MDNMMETQKIFPIELVLDSMKDNGYKDAAHAIAELIDNSIQAGSETEWKTEVELLCIEKEQLIVNRRSSQIDEIAVYDNACGMDKRTLWQSLAFGRGTRRGAKGGIGKFGMGLPNASISQCNRVDVYSWQDGQVFHTYLDLEELAKTGMDEVPEPQQTQLPKKWKRHISSEIRKSGTLVIWSRLDRLKWRRHKAFFSNVEFIVGRMYRNFLNDSCSIRMTAINPETNEVLANDFVKPNDPLYLMEKTNTPPPFDTKGGFVKFGDDKEIVLRYRGEEHKVTLRFSVADHEFRKNFRNFYPEKNYGNPGDTPFGKHCGRNLGISIVRAGRELELNNSYTITYDPTERWWGAELLFEPGLDEVFGVTNNKQAATALQKLTIEDLAESEGFDSTADARRFLEQEDDIRLPVIQLSEEITRNLRVIRSELSKQREGSARASEIGNQNKSKAVQAAQRVDSTIDGVAESDTKAQSLSYDEKTKEYESELERDGIDLPDEERVELITKALANDEKFILNSAELRGADVIFDVSTPAGKLKITINESHPIYKTLFADLSKDERAYDIIKLLFASWAIMEDREQDDDRKDWLLDVRKNWGFLVKKMLQEYSS
tara:strand:- start:1746 stop:3557 length:1812 start_codon:yes stop_codon:yes gene_type:complete